MNRTFVVALIALAACKTVAPAAPPVTVVAKAAVAPPLEPLPDVVFRAGGPPRSAMMMSATIAAPAAQVARIDAVARRLEIPEPLGQALLAVVERSALAARYHVSGATVDALDGARPFAMVFLGPSLGAPTGFCLAFAFRDAAGARRMRDALGVETERRGAESVRRLPDGTLVRAGVHERTLLISATPGLIAVAGALAEELQATPPEAAYVFRVHPPAFMSLGPEVMGALFEKAITGALSGTKNLPTAGSAPPKTLDLAPGLARLAGVSARLLARPLAEAKVLTIALDLDEHAGLALRLGVEALPGTSLARVLAMPSTSRLDPRLPLRGDGSLAFAWDAAPALFDVMGTASTATGPAGKTFGAGLGAFLERIVGAGSCAVDVIPLRSVCAFPLRATAKARDVLRRYGQLTTERWEWRRELATAVGHRPDARLKGGVLEIEADSMLQDLSPEGHLADSLLGTGPGGVAATVKDGLLVVAEGDQPRVALTAFFTRSSQDAFSTPILTATSALGRDAAAFGLFDLVSVMTRWMNASSDERLRSANVMMRAIRGLTALNAPFVLLVRPGTQGAFELRLPIESLDNAARLLRPYYGVMGAPPPR